MRGGLGIDGLQELTSSCDREACSSPKAGRRRSSRVQPDAGHHDRDAREPLRARLGAEDAARRQAAARCSTATTRTRWRCISTRRPCCASAAAAAFGGGGRGGGANVPPVGNMQPNAAQPTLTTLDGPPPAPPAAAGGGRGGRGGRGGGGRPVRPAAAAGAEPEAAPGGGGGGGRGGGRGGSAAAPNPNAPRVLLSFPTDANDLLLSGLLVGGESDHRPRRRDRRADRQGTRRDVRQPSVLALADAGELLPRLQRDPELERSRRGPDRAASGDDARGAVEGTCGFRLQAEEADLPAAAGSHRNGKRIFRLNPEATRDLQRCRNQPVDPCAWSSHWC